MNYILRLSINLLLIFVLLAACETNDISKPANNMILKSMDVRVKKVKNTQRLYTMAVSSFIKSDAKPLDVPLINQLDNPQLYNGCEVSSLAMVLNFMGYEATKNELAMKISKVPITYENGLKGNPNTGFVGDMKDGPGLTVYHGPIYDLAKEYAGTKALDITGSPIEKLYFFVTKGLPIWVITTINFHPTDKFKTWETPTGRVKVTYSVHSVVITGVDEDFVYVNNPYGQKNQKVDKESFEKSWKQMGSQAVVVSY